MSAPFTHQGLANCNPCPPVALLTLFLCLQHPCQTPVSPSAGMCLEVLTQNVLTQVPRTEFLAVTRGSWDWEVLAIDLGQCS